MKKQWHIVVIFFFSNIKKNTHTQKNNKKITKKREGVFVKININIETTYSCSALFSQP
jgi:tRNA (Thr-GGU) A37 N-methylase